MLLRGSGKEKPSVLNMSVAFSKKKTRKKKVYHSNRHAVRRAQIAQIHTSTFRYEQGNARSKQNRKLFL